LQYPFLLEKRVAIESVDPEGRSLVRVSLDPAWVVEWDPPEALGCLAKTKLSDVMTDVGSAFCEHAHHFADPDSAWRFTQANPARFALEMSKFHAAAVLLHQRIWA
jgi:hypothetical protein